MTQCDKILDLFKQKGGSFMTSDIPYDLAFEARARISDLRRRGYDIRAEMVERNNWRYTWVQNKEYYYEQSGQGLLL